MLMCQINNENIKYLRTIIDTASNIVSGPRTFKFTPEGLSFESMDQGSVFVYFKVNNDFFSKYELKNDVLELRINIDDLKKVLSRAISADELLTLNFSDSNKFGINFSKASGQGQKRKYELALHNPDDEEKRDISEVIKGIPLSCKMVLPPGSLKDILSDVGIAGEKDSKHLTINVDSTLAKFEINKGSEGMNALVEIPVSDNSYSITLEDEDAVNASYDMEYLDKLTRLDPVSNSVDLEMGTDKPLRITFKISNSIDFIFVMAPLVQEDEDDMDESYDDDE